MRSLPSFSLAVALFTAFQTHAITFPFHVNIRTTASNLNRRTDIPRQSSINGTLPIANTHNAEYISNITLGGRSVAVMLDTGRYASHSQPSNRLFTLQTSSDLWVTGTGYQSTDTGKSVTLAYAVGKASGMTQVVLELPWDIHLQFLGDIFTGTLQLGDYTVEDQAFCPYFCLCH
jgi:hypothetical protein